ncbi:sigma-70 family RNA polymerase sigma factor [Stieleria sp. TO1_6]|uniref:sigma-70 family RNA polymerase sigma factor n=1 Tax=Stieleria tagensis TaxID=2956795 RepID=UPI00209B7FE3|nr:sigma-70 family RNA polymerase sigma factor [Stieleria tagensis]MCO8124029.1 sigma-70 family RNA polymerase sigma factor [Stieleria tagensis]
MQPSEHQNTDDSAIVTLLTECQLPLRLYVRALMPGDSAAGDVIQQANSKIWEKRSEFEIGTQFKAWAFAIARFEVLNHRKKQARDARIQFSDELESTIAAELQQVDDGFLQRQQALRQCLELLKPSNRELLLGRYASKQPLADFASQLGRPVGSVKVTLHRLRTSLADCIERRLVSAGESR